jgi:hypothetical protein
LKVGAHDYFGDVAFDQKLLTDSGIGEHDMRDALYLVVEKLETRLLDRLAELEPEDEWVVLFDE